MIRGVLSSLVAGIVLSGCVGTSIPTQRDPSCSWDSTVPANAASICTAVYDTLNSVARAEERGNTSLTAHLVSNVSTRSRILAHGRSLRAQKVQGLHVVPSITLDQISPHVVGAGFYLNGNVAGGRVNAPLTVELRVHAGQAVIINDQPGQEW